MKMSSDSDEWTKLDSGVDSPSADDSNDGNVGGIGPLKKGPWTSAEDAILVDYVTKHGEGNWNAVQKHSGLARCGKSCRLRWTNHLRPDLKKGAFTPEEENRIIELHAKMGNKWARMAVELPGRTDNEIKNYWNTRIKRRQRAGLPIYPPDISQSLHENGESDSLNNLSSGNDHHQGLMAMDHLEIPSVEFENLDLNNHILSALPDFPSFIFLDMHSSNFLAQSLNSSYHDNSLHPAVHQSKRLRGSELSFPDSSSPVYSAFPGGNEYQSESSMQIGDPSVFTEYDHNPATDHERSSSSSDGSHAVLNEHPSSEPAGAMKLELPSLQTPSSPLPFYDSADILIQTPPNEQMPSCNLSPQNSGLLDNPPNEQMQPCNLSSQSSGLLNAVLQESEVMRVPEGNVHHNQNSMAINTIDDSANLLYDTEWRADEEQLSPFGHSSSSLFSESTRVSGNSLDDPFYSGALPVTEDAIHGGLVTYDDIVDPRDEFFFSRPDFLLEWSCFGSFDHPTEEHSLLNDATGTLSVDDREKVDLGASSSAQAHAQGSGAWNTMPRD